MYSHPQKGPRMHGPCRSRSTRWPSEIMEETVRTTQFYPCVYTWLFPEVSHKIPVFVLRVERPGPSIIKTGVHVAKNISDHNLPKNMPLTISWRKSPATSLENFQWNWFLSTTPKKLSSSFGKIEDHAESDHADTWRRTYCYCKKY